LIPLALKAVLGTAPPLTVFGKNLNTSDGTSIRDFIHVSDRYFSGSGSNSIAIGDGNLAKWNAICIDNENVQRKVAMGFQRA
jgi:UDP-glucose 4-epimerase